MSIKLSVCYILISIAVLGAAVGVASDEVDSRLEIEAVRKAAVEYFDAEIRCDLKAVYYSIAPSSVFRTRYSFQNYVDMYSRGGPRVKSYRIDDIGGITPQLDEEAHPKIEMIADVTVFLEVFDPKTGKTHERTTIFVFVKENGIWYKG